MRNTFLLSTAALLVALSTASAQNAVGGAKPESRGEGGGSQSLHGSPTEPSRVGQSGREQSKSKQAQPQNTRGNGQESVRSEGKQDPAEGRAGETTGQRQSAGDARGESKDTTTADDKKDARPKGKQAQPQNQQKTRQSGQSTGQSHERQVDEGKRRGNQAQRRRNTEQRSIDGNRGSQTTGQAQREQSAQPPGNAKQDQSQKNGGTRDRNSTQAVQSQEGQQGQKAREGRATLSEQSKGSGRIELSTEQRTRIRQTVFAQRNAPRVSNVSFSLSVGTVVPTRTHVVAVPRALIEIHPEFRDHMYFVVRDEMVIVDRSRRIVAVIPIGGSGSAAVSTAGLNLSKEEIRQVQLVLIERGFLDGPADGVFGTRTREALVAFQRREGLEVSQRIDTRTITALGLSEKFGAKTQQGATSGESSTVGKGQNRTQSSGQNAGAGKQGPENGGQPSTSGQSNDRAKQSPANRGAETQRQGSRTPNAPATTGQGAGASEQPPANRDAGPDNSKSDRGASPKQNSPSNNRASPATPSR